MFLLRHGVQQLLQTVVESGRHGRRPWFHGDESAVWFVHGFIGLVSRPHVLEHFADHLRSKRIVDQKKRNFGRVSQHSRVIGESIGEFDWTGEKKHLRIFYC